MAEVVIRPAGEADFPAIAAMYARLDAYFRELDYAFPEVPEVGQAWLDSFRRTLGRFSILVLAEVDGRPAGFGLGRIKRVAPYMGGVLVGELSDVYVEPEARRLGLGERLVQRVFAWLREQGVHSIETQILEGNQASMTFFERQGFRPELRLYRLTWEAEPDA